MGFAIAVELPRDLNRDKALKCRQRLAFYIDRPNDQLYKIDNSMRGASNASGLALGDALRAAIDLNVMRVLCAVHETRSVTRASQLLSLTQPAISYSLSRLREYVSDPLFLRTKAGMMPTACADKLYADFRNAIDLVNSALNAAADFDPQVSKRRFRIAVSDLEEMIFIPPIAKFLSKNASNVTVEVHPVGIADLKSALDCGRIDLAVGNIPSLQDRTDSQHVFTDQYVCLLRGGDQGLTKLSLAQFAKSAFVQVVSPHQQYFVEDALAAQGIDLKVALQVPNLTSIPDVVAETDLIAIVPSSVAMRFVQAYPVRALAAPVKLPSFDARIFWSSAGTFDRGRVWLREAFISAFKSTDNDPDRNFDYRSLFVSGGPAGRDRPRPPSERLPAQAAESVHAIQGQNLFCG